MFLLGVSKQRRKRQGSWWPSRGHGESPTELLLNEKQKKNSSNSHYSLRSVLCQQPQKSHAVSEKLIVLLCHLVLGKKKISVLFRFMVLSRFSVYWAYNNNCYSILPNDRPFDFYQIRNGFFPALYFFTQLRGSKNIITNNSSRMVQLMLIYTTN